MRFALVPLSIAIAGCAMAAAHPAGRAAPLRPLVILVHGRGQLGFDSAATRREWQLDLDSSLALVGMPKLRDDDVRLAWYADVMDPEANDECTFSSERDTIELGFGALARGFLASLTGVLSETQESVAARGLIGDLLYFLDAGTRCGAEQRVGRTIDAAVAERRPVVVVAYSLGSVVAYGYLSSRTGHARGATDLRLITIGSPLGVREIRELLMDGAEDSLRVPPGVGTWENVFDPDDVFSAPLSGSVAAPGIRRIRDHATSDPSTGNSHYIGRYLRDRSTGAAVARALCATAKDQFGGACSRLSTVQP